MLISAWVLWIWLPALLLLAGGYLAWTRRRRRGVAIGGRVPLAHLAELQALPRYRLLRRRQRVVAAASALAVLLLLLSAIGLTARPARAHVVAQPLSNRDVMLCLDVSDSMSDLDRSLLGTFSSVIGQLRGQRIGMAIFDTNTVLKFPLTTDDAFARRQLQLGIRALTGQQPSDAAVSWEAGTLGSSEAEGSSLIGDGMVSCAEQFDQRTARRSRAVIFASDGEPGSPAIYSMPQAGAYVHSLGVRLYCLSRVDPAHQDADYRDQDYADFRGACQRTGGGIYYAGDTSAVGSIVHQILALEASRLKAPPQRVRDDDPAPLAIIALVAVAGLVGVSWWGLR